MEYAVSLAKDFRAKIFLLHVMELPVYGQDLSLMHPRAVISARHKLMETMQQWVEKIKNQGVETDGDFVTGVPSWEILDAAKKHEPDLIVMGTHGRTGLAHIMLGSTAERVIQRARCPVLTVKAVPGPSGKEKSVSEVSHPTIGQTPGSRTITFCHLCGQPSQDIVCETCKIRVQEEAFERSERTEKGDRVETGRR
jgi:nucleotide-binding universal stress UspA family protein